MASHVPEHPIVRAIYVCQTHTEISLAFAHGIVRSLQIVLGSTVAVESWAPTIKTSESALLMNQGKPVHKAMLGHSAFFTAFATARLTLSPLRFRWRANVLLNARLVPIVQRAIAVRKPMWAVESLQFVVQPWM